MNKKQIVLTITTLLSFSGITSADYVIQFNNSQSKGMIPEQSVPETFSSCKDILDNGQSTGDGVYAITVNDKKFDVYCDMTSAGGGWTMIVAQFEQDPVTNWNEGIQADYDPSLSANKGFALNTQEIPSHTQTAFGKDLDADNIDYVDFIYKTGDIQKTQLSGLKASYQYHVHRNEFGNYSDHNPENEYKEKSSSDEWRNTLTFDYVDHFSDSYTFSFSPLVGIRSYRGYGFNGDMAYTSSDSFAWTVWVR